MRNLLLAEAYERLYPEGSAPTRKRLTATMSGRKRYTIHYMTLMFYLQLGMILTKVHRVLGFTQRPFLKPYIDFCTNKRAAATTEFRKRLWKLCVNSCFGKFIESVRKYQQCKIVTNSRKLQNALTNPLLDGMTIVSEDCVVLTARLEVLKMQKPITVGFTILERSKDFMYKAFYKDIKPKFENCTVIFSDTDSLCLKIQSRIPITPLTQLADLMDFSNYPVDHPNHDSSRRNKLFFFKDELAGERMTEYVGLRSKCYAYKTQNENCHKKLKGITKGYRKEISFNSYLKCVREMSKLSITQYHIRSRSHHITMDRAHRVGLNSYDANRYLLPCGIHSVPYGSVLIQKNVRSCIFCSKCVINKDERR